MLKLLDILKYIGKSFKEDYIVEHGTSGIWTYRKWNSGDAECWGEYSATLTHYYASGGFYGYWGTIQLPFNFTKVNCKTYTAQVGAGFAIPASSTWSDGNGKVAFHVLATYSGTQTVTIRMTIKGKWK